MRRDRRVASRRRRAAAPTISAYSGRAGGCGSAQQRVLGAGRCRRPPPRRRRRRRPLVRAGAAGAPGGTRRPCRDRTACPCTARARRGTSAVECAPAVEAQRRHRVVRVDDAHAGGRSAGCPRRRGRRGSRCRRSARGGGARRRRDCVVEQRLDDLGADHRMLAHELPLLVVERARLEQHAVGDRDLADVVQVGDLFDLRRWLVRPAQLSASITA